MKRTRTYSIGRARGPAARRWCTLVIVVSAIVLIGPAELLPSLSQRVRPPAKGASYHSFTSDQSTEALAFIRRHRPPVVALEREFSSSPPGIVFLRRIKKDPSLAECDVRIVAVETTTTTSRKKSGSAIAVAKTESPTVTVKPTINGTRRVPRVRMSENVSVTVDGNPAVLVDLSAQGAQVLSPVVLRPNQRVRLAFSEDDGSVRCAGAVQWASFEMPVGQPPRYRAGVRFSGDVDALAGYAERHRADRNGSD